MRHSLLASFLFLALLSSIASAQLADRNPPSRYSSPAGGYQLYYKSIPPKPKQAEPEPKVFVRQPDTEGEKQSKALLRVIRDEGLRGRYEVEAKFSPAQPDPNADIARIVEAARRNSYIEQQRQQQNDAAVYNAAYAAAYNYAAAAAERARYPQQSILIVQPWDNIRDTWGIWAPGWRHNQAQTFIITQP